MRYAVVRNGAVDGYIEWAGTGAPPAPAGATVRMTVGSDVNGNDPAGAMQATIAGNLSAALGTVRNYLALPAPTPMDESAVVKVLAQIVVRMARLQLGALDADL